MPAELLENELFGHEAGAFTSAQRKQLGLVAQAEEGTLFLDEIDALPLQAQAALLRFLQDHCYRPLGSGRLNQAHVRIMAASNADLPAQVKQNQLREDLWYRLNVLTLKLPPLRERRADIPLLANLRRFYEAYHQPVKEFPTQTLAQLVSYPWPGNVRELENWVQRAFLLGEERLPAGELVAGFQTQSLEEVKHALEWLIQRGLLDKQKLPDGRIIFRKIQAGQRPLSSQTRPAPSPRPRVRSWRPGNSRRLRP